MLIYESCFPNFDNSNNFFVTVGEAYATFWPGWRGHVALHGGTQEMCTIWILGSKYMSYMTRKDTLLYEVGLLVNSLKKLESSINLYASRYSLFVFKKVMFNLLKTCVCVYTCWNTFKELYFLYI